jgi:hypothetical protein
LSGTGLDQLSRVSLSPLTPLPSLSLSLSLFSS